MPATSTSRQGTASVPPSAASKSARICASVVSRVQRAKVACIRAFTASMGGVPLMPASSPTLRR